MNRTIVILIIILILGTFFRFYRLGEIPAGFHRDEAFLGYNAYSILRTGKDMHGIILPLHLKSFLYSPAGYSYLSIPFIAIFDLNAFSVRFASAFFGSITILVTYFLTKELFLLNSNFKIPASTAKRGERNPKHPPDGGWKLEIPIIAAAMLAVSPWHINLSRTATENVAVVFFVVLGVLLFIFWQKRGKWWFLVGAFLSFGFTFLLYQSPRAFLPIFLLMMGFFLSRPNAIFDKRKMIPFVTLFLVTIIMPLLFIIYSKELSLRIRTVSIFATEETQLVIDGQLREDGVSDIKSQLARVFHNKVIGYSQQFLQNYFAHFSYEFLFTDRGLPDRYRVPLMGLLHIFELPFFSLGIWSLLKEHRRVGLFLITWVFIAFIGSAFTFDDVPNLQRTLLVNPSLSIISAYGILYFFYLIKTIGKTVYAVKFILAVIVLFSIIYYLHQYYIHVNRYRPWYRHDGYKQLVAKVNSLLPKYKKVIITDRESAPTIFFLFYGRYDPSRFQEEKQKNMKDFDRINFGKYEFSQEECPLRLIKKEEEIITTGEKDVLYVDSGLCKIPHNVRILDTIKRLDNSLVFFIVR